MRKLISKKAIRNMAILFITVLLGCTSVCPLVSAETLKEMQDSDYGTEVDFDFNITDNYAAKLLEYSEKKYTAAIGNEVTVSAADYRSAATTPALKDGAVVFNSANEFIEWDFAVPSTGLYNIVLTYKTAENTHGNIKRGLLIDGKSPFDECTNLTLYRLWKDDGKPRENSAGDQIRPSVVEIPDWQTVTVTDASGMYTDGLKFYLTEGRHTLRLTALRGDMYLKTISFVPVKSVKSYKEISKSYGKISELKVKPIRFEAESNENTVSKTSSVLRMDTDGDPATTPFKYGHSMMNVLGGSSWSSGGITWKFSVPESGYYSIGMRMKQDYRDGLPSYRRILIDGELPFKEFEEYSFIYDKDWQQTVLGSDENNPYYVYLEAGKEHTLTMTAALGSCHDLYTMVEADSLKLSQLLLDINMITGDDIDVNYDYELEKYIPGLVDTLKELADNMADMMVLMQKISKGEPAKYYQLKSMIVQLENMIEDTYIIPTHTDELDNILTSYGTWMSEFKSQPLMVDFISVIPAGGELKEVKSAFYEKLYAGIVNFAMTFVKDYSNAAGTLVSDVEIKETIDVWVARGTQWTTLIKQMADENFTSKTGIGVTVNTLTAGQLNAGTANALLLAVSSGRAPDVSMGTAIASVGEFAMRNAVVDLTEFEDYESVSKRFIDKMFVRMKYNDGIYGLPETMNFKVMIYRKDILSQIGVHLPKTWQELEDYVIPILYRNNMNFFMGPSEYTTLLYQHGGSYYTDDLKYSAIGSAEGYQAFKAYTDLFSIYGVPVSANFFNRFRNGEMPLGIVDFTNYMMISAAAPELVGKWGITEIPGVKGEDGKINNTNTDIGAESVMIMSQTDKKESAWEFIKWWTSTDTQIQFGAEIESLIGETARWNTANVEAFEDMPWDNADLKVIMNSYKNVDQIPVVLGGYFTDRHINNAFNRTVVSGMDAMSSLEKAVKDINRELKRRRE